MSADYEVGFRVLVDQSGAGLQPLPSAIFLLESVRYHPRGPRLQH